jgi:ankyrin repeat protein
MSDTDGSGSDVDSIEAIMNKIESEDQNNKYQYNSEYYDDLNYNDSNIRHPTNSVAANVSYTDNINLSYNGMTPVIFAVKSRNVALLQILYDCKADFDMLDGEGNTPLICAIEAELSEIVHILLIYGVNPNSANINLVTPLMYAAKKNNYGIFMLLLQEFGASLHAVDRQCKNVLDYVIQSYNLDILTELIKSMYIDINKEIVDGTSLLIYACKYNLVKLIDLLLEFKADVNYVDKDNNSALYYAITKNNKNIFYKLLDANADVNLIGPKNTSMLAYAVKLNNKEMVLGLLLVKGIIIDTINDNGNTPLHIAILHKYKEIAILLESYGANVHIETGLSLTPFRLAIIEWGKDAAKEIFKPLIENDIPKEDLEQIKQTLILARPNGECAVCYEQLDINNCIVTSCRHIYCNTCIYKIYKENDELRCPDCRTLLINDDD